MASFSHKITVLEKVDSTNNYAMSLIKNNDAIDGNGVFAIEQTMGKGRRGKEWKSATGENIIFSITRQMQWLPVSRQFELSMAVALGCYDLVSKYVSEKVYIKWPNDIFINDSKAGGILIENIIKGTLWQWTVIGIGINVNQNNFDSLDKVATSLKKVAGESFDVMKLTSELHQAVIERTDRLKTENVLDTLREYNDHLYKKDESVFLKKDNIIIETLIKNVNSKGQLITIDSEERFFVFGEVEWI